MTTETEDKELEDMLGDTEEQDISERMEREQLFKVKQLRRHVNHLFGVDTYLFDAMMKVHGHNEEDQITKKQAQRYIDSFLNSTIA